MILPGCGPVHAKTFGAKLDGAASAGTWKDTYNNKLRISGSIEDCILPPVITTSLMSFLRHAFASANPNAMWDHLDHPS